MKFIDASDIIHLRSENEPNPKWKRYSASILVICSKYLQYHLISIQDCLMFESFPPPGPPPVPILSFVGLSGDVSRAVNVTVSWTLSARDSADFYLINITTNAPQTPYGGLLNITNANVTQQELTGFMAGYEYNITVRGVNCKNQEGGESGPLTIRPQGTPP